MILSEVWRFLTFADNWLRNKEEWMDRQPYSPAKIFVPFYDWKRGVLPEGVRRFVF